MVATLLVGTPALTFMGAVGAALTATLRRGGLILAILVLPLMIPTLIFGVSAANAAVGGTVPFATPFLILVALSLVAAVIGTAGRRGPPLCASEAASGRLICLIAASAPSLHRRR